MNEHGEPIPHVEPAPDLASVIELVLRGWGRGRYPLPPGVVTELAHAIGRAPESFVQVVRARPRPADLDEEAPRANEVTVTHADGRRELFDLDKFDDVARFPWGALPAVLTGFMLLARVEPPRDAALYEIRRGGPGELVGRPGEPVEVIAELAFRVLDPAALDRLAAWIRRVRGKRPRRRGGRRDGG